MMLNLVKAASVGLIILSCSLELAELIAKVSRDMPRRSQSLHVARKANEQNLRAPSNDSRRELISLLKRRAAATEAPRRTGLGTC